MTTTEPTTRDVAVAWRAYVMTAVKWSDALWIVAVEKGLARKVESKDPITRWTLTDAGLDLYIAGAPLDHEWPSLGVVLPEQPSRI